MSFRFAGTAYVRVNGESLKVRGNLMIHHASSVRTGVAGQDGVHGFSEMPAVPAIELDVSTGPDFSAEDIEARDDDTVMAETAWNKTYVLRNAWKAGVMDINTAEGSVRIRFEGMSIQEF